MVSLTFESFLTWGHVILSTCHFSKIGTINLIRGVRLPREGSGPKLREGMGTWLGEDLVCKTIGP